MKLKTYIFFTFCILHFTFSFAQDNSKMEVMMKMSELRSGLLSKDSISLSKLLSNDVTYGHTNGLIQTKAELIHDLMTKVQDYKSIAPSDMNIRVYGNTAVVNINVGVKMEYNAKPLEMNMHVVLVWIKNNGNWELVARQSVKY
jgi:hypothetical protein